MLFNWALEVIIVKKSDKGSKVALVILVVFVIFICVFVLSIFDTVETEEVNAQQTLHETLAHLGEKAAD